MNESTISMPEHTDVLVVGLGPVGAAFSLLCAQLGLSVRAVERDTDIYKQPRAVQIDFEVMRQLNLVGVADEVMAASCASEGYEFVNADGELLTARYPPPGNAPTGYPYANLFHQPSMEEALRARLAQSTRIAVHLGTEAVHLKQESSKVFLQVREFEEERTYAADYLVGCDGASSFVRRFLGIDMDDSGFEEPWVVVDVKLPKGMRQLHSHGIQYCDPAGPTTCVPSGPGRHRWEFMLKSEADRALAQNHEALKLKLSRWIDPETIEIERSAIYEFHGLIATTWHQDKCLLIGDSAHQMPPFFGQGLCSGIRDALNLAWKLCAVIRRDAPSALLETLMPERAPHVAGITEGAIELGRIVCTADREEAQKRDQRMLADMRAGRPPQFPTIPDIEYGVLPGGVGGRVFPSPKALHANGTPMLLDDLVGYVPILVLAADTEITEERGLAIDQLRACSRDLAVCGFDSQAVAVGNAVRLLDEGGMVEKALAGAPALLVKPDRIQFGAGEVLALAQGWSSYLGGVLKL